MAYDIVKWWDENIGERDALVGQCRKLQTCINSALRGDASGPIRPIRPVQMVNPTVFMDDVFDAAKHNHVSASFRMKEVMRLLQTYADAEMIAKPAMDTPAGELSHTRVLPSNFVFTY